MDQNGLVGDDRNPKTAIILTIVGIIILIIVGVIAVQQITGTSGQPTSALPILAMGFFNPDPTQKKYSKFLMVIIAIVILLLCTLGGAIVIKSF